MVKLSYPSAELQAKQWTYHLSEYGMAEEVIIEMVEKQPTHISEIDFYVERAKLESILKQGDQSKTGNYLESVIKTYRKTVPILFG